MGKIPVPEDEVPPEESDEPSNDELETVDAEEGRAEVLAEELADERVDEAGTAEPGAIAPFTLVSLRAPSSFLPLLEEDGLPEERDDVSNDDELEEEDEDILDDDDRELEDRELDEEEPGVDLAITCTFLVGKFPLLETQDSRSWLGKARSDRFRCSLESRKTIPSESAVDRAYSVYPDISSRNFLAKPLRS